MERVEADGVVRLYLNGKLMLTISSLGNDMFVVENDEIRLEGFCKALDDYRFQYRLDKNLTKGKNGRLYSTKKLKEHNGSWFAYILQEEGFVPKTKPVK